MGGACSNQTVAKKALMIGPKNSGKTQLLYRWCLGEGIEVTTKPTEGFNVERVQHEGLELLVWDVSDTTRRRQFFQGTEVYVLDSSDRKATEGVNKDITALLKERDLSNTPLLIIAAKQDVNGCMLIDEVKQQLEVIVTASTNKFIVVGTSINNWDSVQNALKALCDLILGK